MYVQLKTKQINAKTEVLISRLQSNLFVWASILIKLQMSTQVWTKYQHSVLKVEIFLNN